MDHDVRPASIEDVRPQQQHFKTDTTNNNDDEERFLQQQIDGKTTEVERLQSILAQKIRHTKNLRDQLDMYQDSESSMSMKLERYRALRMSKWWILSVCVSLFCLAGAFSKGSLTYGVINFWAFLLVWRGLYVEKNQGPWLVAIALILFTLKFS